MRILPRATVALAAVASLVAAAPAMGAYSDGVGTFSVADANPSAVAVPLTIKTQRTDPSDTQDSAVLYFEVPGFVLNPGTSSGEAIGFADLDSSIGLITTQVNTAGPKSDPRGTAHAGSWSANVPVAGPIPVYVDQNTGLGANKQPAAEPGNTLLTIFVPTSAQLAGAKLKALTVRLNTDANGCKSTGVGATNPATPGAYSLRTVFVPYGSAGAPDPSQAVDRTSAPVNIAVGPKPVVPAKCSGSTQSVPKAKVKLTAKPTKVKVGQIATLTLKNTGGAAKYKITKKAGSSKPKVVRIITVGAKKTVTYKYKAPKADAGKTVKFTAAPVKNGAGTTSAAVVKVAKLAS